MLLPEKAGSQEGRKGNEEEKKYCSLHLIRVFDAKKGMFSCLMYFFKKKFSLTLALCRKTVSFSFILRNNILVEVM